MKRTDIVGSKRRGINLGKDPGGRNKSRGTTTITLDYTTEDQQRRHLCRTIEADP